MAHVWADRVAETTTTTGTGALTLAGAVTGFQAFSAVCSVGDTVIYAIEAVSSGAPSGDWEVGVGTYSATSTLTRTTVIKSSNSNAAVSFAAGTKNVFLDDIAETRNQLQQYSGTGEPSAPVEGLINFSKDLNGWPVAMARGAANRSFSLNPFMGGRTTWGGIAPAPGVSNPVGFGGVALASTNVTAVSPIGTNQFAAIARGGITTTATASTAGTVRSTAVSILYRGASANSGFRLLMTGGGLDVVGNTNCRWFFGLINSSAAPAATFDPAAAANVLIGVGATGTDTTNAKLYYATGSVVNSVDLGANFPAKTANGGMFELYLTVGGSSATSVNYLVRRLDDLTITPVTGTLTTNLPAAGVMFPHYTINNNATATASAMVWSNTFWEGGI